MTGVATDPRTKRRERIERERRQRPESAPWLRLVHESLDAAERAPWIDPAVRLAPGRAADAPLLHEAFVGVERRAARRWVRTLLRVAAREAMVTPGGLGRQRGRGVDPLPLLAASISGDAAALHDQAERVGADPAAFAAVADLAALPLLHGCAAALKNRLPVGWGGGYCPVCGAWPAIAELRGLERTRVLRCGRCSTGWERPVLACPFCDERDHQRQISFAAEGEENRRRADSCRTCQGYLKTVTTLAPIPAWAVRLEDLSTLELDLVAGQRGFQRPPDPGFAAAVRVVAAGETPGLAAGGWA